MTSHGQGMLAFLLTTLFFMITTTFYCLKARRLQRQQEEGYMENNKSENGDKEVRK